MKLNFKKLFTKEETQEDITSLQTFNTFLFEGTTKLVDNKDIRIEGNMETGSKVFLITDETEMPMPDGNDWTLQDGTILTTKDGVIEDVLLKEDQVVEPPVVEPVVEQAKEDVIEDAIVESIEPITEPVASPDEAPEDVVDEETKIKELETKIVDLETKLNDLITKIDTMSAEYSSTKEDLSKTKEEMINKFERVMVVEPVKQNNFSAINITNKNSNLGSYDEIYKK